MYGYERRYLDRFEIPGAKIQYKLQNGNSVKVKLIDITKISVRFYIKHTFKEGEFVELAILLKDKDTISVKGNVVWTQLEDEENNANAVVQLLPFGTDDRYNTMESYEQLAKLAEKYSQENKILNNIYTS